MSLNQQDYINFLINEARRLLITLNSDFYKTLYVFIKSSEGISGFETFQKLEPNKVGVYKMPKLENIFRRIFDI